MCEAVSMGIAATAVTAAEAAPWILGAGAVVGVATVAGAGMSAYGSYQQGQFQKDMAKYQAGLNRQRATMAMKMAEIEAQKAEKRGKQLAGAGLVAAAGNGVLIEARPDAAVSMWEADQAKELAYEKELIRSNAELEAWGFMRNADAQLAQGRMDAWAGTMGAGSSILGGVAGGVSSGIGTASGLSNLLT